MPWGVSSCSGMSHTHPWMLGHSGFAAKPPDCLTKPPGGRLGGTWSVHRCTWCTGPGRLVNTTLSHRKCWQFNEDSREHWTWGNQLLTYSRLHDMMSDTLIPVRCHPGMLGCHTSCQRWVSHLNDQFFIGVKNRCRSKGWKEINNKPLLFTPQYLTSVLFTPWETQSV